MTDTDSPSELDQKYEKLRRDIVTLSFAAALDRLQKISEIMGSSRHSLEETIHLYRYAELLFEYCQTYLEVNEVPPQVIELDRERRPTGLKNLDVMKE